MLTRADCCGVDSDDGDEDLADAPAGYDKYGGPRDSSQRDP